MRILFVGGHTLGQLCFKRLIDEGETIVTAVGIYSEDEWYAGLESLALENDIPFIKPQNINALECIEHIRSLDVDLIVVVNYDQIIKKALIDLPKLGIFNVHAGLLPLYRGRAPLNWAMLRGEKQVGVTIHCVDEGIDSGDILLQEVITIEDHEDIGDVIQRVKDLYPEMVSKVVKQFKTSSVSRTPQNHTLATYFGKRDRSDGKIDWNLSANAIRNLIRALAKPYPGAWSVIEGEELIIWRAEVVDTNMNMDLMDSSPGDILEMSRDVIIMQTGEGILKITDFEKV